MTTIEIAPGTEPTFVPPQLAPRAACPAGHAALGAHVQDCPRCGRFLRTSAVVSAGGETERRTKRFVSIGGGMGSFALVDLLRISGLGVDDIDVISPLAHPDERFRHLATSSRIAGSDPLRSDSMSRIDNPWGFPSYALTEARRHRKLRPLLQVLGEPLVSEFYNPPLDVVRDGLRREERRISWPRMRLDAIATSITVRPDGRYEVRSVRPDGRTIVTDCDDVHVALGYPGIRFSDELRAWRAAHPNDRRFVNAYEPHGHVYERLEREGGTVLVRGAGIVASRVLQSLVEVRDRATEPVVIEHATRSWVDEDRNTRNRRRTGNGVRYQAFTYPKAAGGGSLRQWAGDDDDGARLKAIGGTTTAYRKQWNKALERGARAGWYLRRHAQVTGVRASDHSPNGALLLDLRDLDSNGTNGSVVSMPVTAMIDCTGLDARAGQHELISGIFLDGLAQANGLGRLRTDARFRVNRSGAGSDGTGGGALFASGAMTLGGPLAPVDSYWGMMHAAWDIADALGEAGHLQPLGAMRSVRQWTRWMRGVAP